MSNETLRESEARTALWNKLNKIDNLLLLTGAIDYCFATSGGRNKRAQRIHDKVSRAQDIISAALAELNKAEAEAKR